MTCLYLNKDSQSASCTIKSSDISIQTKHFLSQSIARQNTFSVFRYLSHTPHFHPEHPHNTFLLSVLEYPVFHFAAQWAVRMCLLSYVTLLLQSLPPACRCCVTWNWGTFFFAFLRLKYDPLMVMALSSMLKVMAVLLNTGEIISPWSRMARCVTAEEQSSFLFYKFGVNPFLLDKKHDLLLLAFLPQ